MINITPLEFSTNSQSGASTRSKRQQEPARASKGSTMTVKQVWTGIKLVVKGECPKLMWLVMSGSVEAIEPSHDQVFVDSPIHYPAGGCAFNRDPYAWIHTSGFAQRYGMSKRWLDHSLDNIDSARGNNQTTDKAKNLDWVWLTAIDPYILSFNDDFNFDDCHRVTRITKQQSE